MEQIGTGLGYRMYKGKVGSMDSTKIFAAVETAAKKEGLIKSIYREEHAIYHSVLEAYNAICRGQLGLGNVLRRAGMTVPGTLLVFVFTGTDHRRLATIALKECRICRNPKRCLKG